jgi:hypothetical protein
MDLAIKVDFQVGDKVTTTFGEIKGIVTMVGIEKNTIKYFVEIVDNDGAVGSKWFEAYQLAKAK